MISVLSSVVLAVMALLLSGWVIFCAIQFFRFSRNMVASGDFKAHVQCEKCGTKYDVSAAEFSKSFVSKYKRVTRTRIEGGAFVNRPRYSFYAKKFYCPKCGKRRYAQILNVNELNGMMEKPMLRAGMRWLVYMCIGGMIILAVTAIPMHFINQAREQHVEELKEQRYEEFKERYGF